MKPPQDIFLSMDGGEVAQQKTGGPSRMALRGSDGATALEEYSPLRLAEAGTGETTRTLELKLTVFDQRHYRKLIEARGKTIRRVVRKLKDELGLSKALDAGCGAGFFARVLKECGLTVCGFDGRSENVAEARRRFPEIPFETGDIQDRSILELGEFDLVLCCGLLYHLENPLLAIRHLRALTESCLLIESMCTPDSEASMLLREEPSQEDQSLRAVAFYPSEEGLVKMLYRAGFAVVYRVTPLPDHDDFWDNAEHKRRRTMLVASSKPIDIAGFRLCPEPCEERDPWAKDGGLPRTWPQRLKRFWGSSRRRKYISLANRMRRVIPGMPLPLRLPFGAWWFAEQGALDHELIYNDFEAMERKAVERLVRPGMTVLDVGAHHGLYSLLTSRRVGKTGRVIAFEPSPRERKRLERHLRWNRCSNVRVEPYALGEESGEADLFLVEGVQDGCNSLRPPAVMEPTRRVLVHVRRLDDTLAELNVSHVDFIKLDVEGAELSFLRGARKLLSSGSRPVILAEVQDIRTLPWGYPAREIIQFLVRMNYGWYAPGAEGTLLPVSCVEESYDANLVALPQERAAEIQRLSAEEQLI